MLEDDNDMEKLKQVMGIMSTEIPKLLDAISKQLYSAESAEKMGQTTAEFYKKLKDAGMTDEQAFALTEKFMSNFSMSSMIGQLLGSLPRDRHDTDDRDDIDDEVDKAIKERIRKKIADQHD
jgi:hypothetical protein